MSALSFLLAAIVVGTWNGDWMGTDPAKALYRATAKAWESLGTDPAKAL